MTEYHNIDFFYLVLKIEVSFLTRKDIFKITLALHIGGKFLKVLKEFCLVLTSVLLFFFFDRKAVVPGNFIEFFRLKSILKKIFFYSRIFFMKLNLFRK